jgi:hypothetical protein
MANPDTSTSVATNGAEALAGSNPILFRANVNLDPDMDPKVTIPTRTVSDHQRDEDPMWSGAGGQHFAQKQCA